MGVAVGSVLASRSSAVLAAPLLAAFVLSGCGLSSEDAATEAAVQDAAEELRASIAEDSAVDSTDEAVEESADEPAGGTSGFYTCEDVVPEVIALSEEQRASPRPRSSRCTTSRPRRIDNRSTSRARSVSRLARIK